MPLAFRCCYCFTWNPPRNQHPPPPRLTLPSVPGNPPAITDAPSDASGNSGKSEHNFFSFCKVIQGNICILSSVLFTHQIIWERDMQGVICAELCRLESYGKKVLDSVHIFSKKGQGGNDQKGHFC